MLSVPFSDVVALLKGRSVAIVGSGPGCTENAPGFVDSHDVVVRVQNYKLGAGQGYRCDVHASFYGTSVTKSRDDLIADGVKLCLCKLPNSQPIESEWHRARGKLAGIDYRYIYQTRRGWWPCPVYVPDDARFLEKFNLLGQHQPTTGFAAILDVLECEPGEVLLTGFDFFTSGLHNVNEPWSRKNEDDPIGHRPDLEASWLRSNTRKFPLKFDARLNRLLAQVNV